MSVSFREGLARAIAAALTIAVVAATWDVWWHSALGRDTFWEPSHLFFYSAMLCMIGSLICIFSSPFFEQQFRYSSLETFVAMASSMLAGLLVGTGINAYDLFRRTRVSRL